MSYQGNLFSLEVLQDRSGRIDGDTPKPPKTYADCEPGKAARALPPTDPDAERCQCFGCKYNLIGEIGRSKSASDAELAIKNRYETETWDTCLLDVLGTYSEPGSLWCGQAVSDARAGRLLGISGERFAQVVANAKFRWVDAMEDAGIFTFLRQPVRDYMEGLLLKEDEEEQPIDPLEDYDCIEPGLDTP